MVGHSRPSDSFWGGDGGGPSLGGPSPAPPRGLLEPLAGAEDEVDCFEHDFHARCPLDQCGRASKVISGFVNVYVNES